MREFLNYSRLKKTTKIKTISFGKIILIGILYMFLNIFFFTGPNLTIKIELTGLIIFFSIGGLVVNRNYDNIIGLKSSYPISNEKKQLYDFSYVVLVAILSILTIILIFVILAFTIGEVTNNGPIIEQKPTLYYKKAFNYSLFFFYYFLSTIKNNKKWWLSLFAGIIIYFTINSLTRYILLGEVFKLMAINLTDYSNTLKSIYYFGVIGIFVISILMFIYFSYYNKKPRKNYINK